MKTFLRIIIVLIYFSIFVYVILPTPTFPNPPPDSLQSKEPGDVEDLSLRRAYYTNLSREEVMQHYQSEFKGYRLNYPPEEAVVIIRDQTKSTFLEEIVHPFRESFYINGFEPKSAEYAIVKDGRPWRQKITVKYVQSSMALRGFVIILIGTVSLFLLEVWLRKHD